MKSSVNSRRRTVLAACATASALCSTGLAANKVWNTGFGTWSDPSHWSPNGAPGLVDSATIGSMAAAHDSTVSLDVNATLSALSISNGMILHAKTQQLTVNGNTTISGSNSANGGYTSRLSIWRNASNPYDFKTNDLNVINGADMFLDAPVVNVMGKMTVDSASSIAGKAVFNFYTNSGPALTLDGDLQLGFYGSGPYQWTLNQLGTGRIDLDGTIGDNNAININGFQSSLTINGDQLTDAFDDTIFIGKGCEAAMNLSGGWTLGPTGWIVLQKTIQSGDVRLSGGTLNVNGTITFLGGSDVTGRIQAPLNINSGTVIVAEYDTLLAKNNVTLNGGRINVFESGKAQFDAPLVMNSGSLEMKADNAAATLNSAATFNGGHVVARDFTSVAFNAATTINSGTFDAIDHGAISFNSTTKVNGGTFNGVSNLGGIYFNGPTEYAGTIRMTGDVQQNGAATVNNSATINADVFDMDGKFAINTWNINAPLTVNANRINLNNNVFTGTMNLISTTSSAAQMRVNLPAGQAWTMAGALNITGSGIGTSVDVLAGSDVVLAGQVKVSFDNAISARADFSSTNVTTINTASSLRLDGGSLAAPNTIAGAVINGPGSLKSIASRALTGHGTINAPVAFATAELRAAGGTLHLNGPISSVGIVGAQAGGTLRFGQAFNNSVATRLELNGGTVTGSTITNSKETRGFGTITTAGFVNNGSLNVSNGTLVIDTVSAPDLDGTTETGQIIVSSGTLRVVDPLADTFNGTAAVGIGGALQFEQGWTLGSGGVLSMQGINVNPAVLTAPSQTIAGTLTLPSSARGRFDAQTTFAAGSNTSIAALSTLELLQDGTIAQGAAMSGMGTLRNTAGARLVLMHNSNVGNRLENAGTLQLGSMFSSLTAAGTFAQTSTGVTQFEVFGATPGTLHDKIDVANSAALAGAIALNNGLYNPAYGVPHELIHAATVSGSFENVTGIVMSPTKYWAVTYGPTGVFATAAIPGDANLDGSVNISDFAILGANYNATGTWINGSFNGDQLINISDFALLASNFNTSVTASLPRGAAVPEPASSLAAMAGCLLAARRQRK